MCSRLLGRCRSGLLVASARHGGGPAAPVRAADRAQTHNSCPLQRPLRDPRWCFSASRSVARFAARRTRPRALELGHGAPAAGARPGAPWSGPSSRSCCSPARSGTDAAVGARGATRPALRPRRPVPCSPLSRGCPCSTSCGGLRPTLFRAVSELLLALARRPVLGRCAACGDVLGAIARSISCPARGQRSGRDSDGDVVALPSDAAAELVDAGRARGPLRWRDRARLDAQRGARATPLASCRRRPGRPRTFSACKPSGRCPRRGEPRLLARPHRRGLARRSAAGSSETCTTRAR